MLTVGLAIIVIALVAFDTQPVAVFVNVKVAVPADIPVTNPAFVTVAIPLLLLIHVPPVVGESVVVEPTHTDDAPVILTEGLAIMVTVAVGLDTQPVLVFVKLTVCGAHFIVGTVKVKFAVGAGCKTIVCEKVPILVATVTTVVPGVV